MRIGKLDQRITFEQVVNRKVAANGDQTGAEVDVLTCWAEVKAMTGTRRLQFEQIHNGYPYSIRIRVPFAVEVDDNMIIKWNGKRLTIKSIVPQEARVKELLIEAVQQG